MCLGRKEGERFMIDDIVITIIRARRGKVRIGIDAPPNKNIWREELAHPNGQPHEPIPTRWGDVAAE